jgi:hypothetical protein
MCHDEAECALAATGAAISSTPLKPRELVSPAGHAQFVENPK